jgi:transposase
LPNEQTNAVLENILYPKDGNSINTKKMPDLSYIHKELHKNGVSKKLLWTEYMEDCRLSGEEPLMYSQFCYYIQQDEQKRRATMHIGRKPGEQVEVDWAGDPAHIIDPDTSEIIDAYLFVGVMTYSQYAYVEAFINEKQQAWVTAHVHMYKYFGGIAKILVPDNCKTAVVHNKDWYNQQLILYTTKWRSTMVQLSSPPGLENRRASPMRRVLGAIYLHGLLLHCVMNSSFHWLN